VNELCVEISSVLSCSDVAAVSLLRRGLLGMFDMVVTSAKYCFNSSFVNIKRCSTTYLLLWPEIVDENSLFWLMNVICCLSFSQIKTQFILKRTCEAVCRT